MNKKLRTIIKEKRENLRKECFGFISLDRYIKIQKYLKAAEQIKPKDKIQTKQLELITILNLK